MPEIPHNIVSAPSNDPYIQEIESQYGPNSVTAIQARDQARIGHPASGMTYAAGSALRNAWNSPTVGFVRGVGNKVLDAGPIAGGLSGGALAAGLGYGIDRLRDYFDDEEPEDKSFLNRNMGAILGGLAGLGLGSYIGSKRTVKQSNVKSASSLGLIQQAIQGDYTMSQDDKTTLGLAATQLSPRDQEILVALLRTAGSAVVGVLIARFLAKAGVGGMLLGALLGGAAGSTLLNQSSSTLAGTKHLDKTDAFGNPYRY